MMRALTLIRPWDEPIVKGVKTVENRSWKPPDDVVGTHIAIHAGQKYSFRDADWIDEVGGYVTLPAHVSQRTRPMTVVGVARVVGWVHGVVTVRRRHGFTSTVRLLHGMGGIDEDAAWKAIHLPWFCGPFGWLLDEAVAIAPVPCRGRQKLWTLPDDVECVVRERWDAARAA